ncbi:uncharacterized protein LOC128233918 [Mya arenaria]|uniref:uncharacterized protein LOC128233918 n=1 Tax=Mya arenaria TaxID=6604 RepID=UPI0022E786C9|nr:uncharacterized protein LOC128233918 [Mya arenaria]
MEGNWTVKIIGLGSYSYELCSIDKTELQFFGTNEYVVVKENSPTHPDITTQEQRPSDDHHSNVVVIVVIVIAVVIVIVVVSMIVYYCCFRNRCRQSNQAERREEFSSLTSVGPQ